MLTVCVNKRFLVIEEVRYGKVVVASCAENARRAVAAVPREKSTSALPLSHATVVPPEFTQSTAYDAPFASVSDSAQSDEMNWL